ncbi:WG repeat-containing protein [Micromonospora halophytica]|uniref:WG containing repeat-containing protein n=1 Tax=Micromonospora halophytica TaxID=47864 RepID=A0A1C5GXU7_9ACTN|nr:WG repeat-containing protein [Micromonospora halophytica]SCG38533.1 WG containing repeat-containing protein [Micromonospora halophytica]
MSSGYRWNDPAEPSWVVEPTTEWHPQFPGQRYPGDIGSRHVPPPARGRAAAIGRAEVPPLAPTRPDGTYLGRSWADHDEDLSRWTGHPVDDERPEDEPYRPPAGERVWVRERRQPEPDRHAGRRPDQQRPGPAERSREAAWHPDRSAPDRGAPDRYDGRPQRPAAGVTPVSPGPRPEPVRGGEPGWLPEPGEALPPHHGGHDRRRDTREPGPGDHRGRTDREIPGRYREHDERRRREYDDRPPAPRGYDDRRPPGYDDGHRLPPRPDERWQRGYDDQRRNDPHPQPDGYRRPDERPYLDERRRSEERGPWRESSARAEAYPDRRPREAAPPAEAYREPWPRDRDAGHRPGTARPEYARQPEPRPDQRRPVEPPPGTDPRPGRHDDRPAARGQVPGAAGPVPPTRPGHGPTAPGRPISPAPISPAPISGAPVSGPPVPGVPVAGPGIARPATDGPATARPTSGAPGRPVTWSTADGPGVPRPTSGAPARPDQARPTPERSVARPTPDVDRPTSGAPVDRSADARPVSGGPGGEPGPQSAARAADGPALEITPERPRRYVPPSPAPDPVAPPPRTTVPNSAEAWFRPAKPVPPSSSEDAPATGAPVGRDGSSGVPAARPTPTDGAAGIARPTPTGPASQPTGYAPAATPDASPSGAASPQSGRVSGSDQPVSAPPVTPDPPATPVRPVSTPPSVSAPAGADGARSSAVRPTPPTDAAPRDPVDPGPVPVVWPATTPPVVPVADPQENQVAAPVDARPVSAPPAPVPSPVAPGAAPRPAVPADTAEDAGPTPAAPVPPVVGRPVSGPPLAARPVSAPPVPVSAPPTQLSAPAAQVSAPPVVGVGARPAADPVARRPGAASDEAATTADEASRPVSAPTAPEGSDPSAAPTPVADGPTDQHDPGPTVTAGHRPEPVEDTATRADSAQPEPDDETRAADLPAVPASVPPAGPASEPTVQDTRPADEPDPHPATPTDQPPDGPAPQATTAPAATAPDTAPSAPKAAPPATATVAQGDPEQVLAGYRWRLDQDTLCEVVDDPDELRTLRRRLTEKLGVSLDNRARARLLSLRAVVSRVVDDLDDALADGRLALTYAEATGELRRTALARARLAEVLRRKGEHAEADRLFAEANSTELPDRLRAALHEHAGRSCYDQGRLMEACEHFERALDLRRADDPELTERIRISLDAVHARAAARGGFGPYPRTREEVLRGHRSPVPTFDGGLGLWGYADTDGELVIGYTYAEAQPFSEGKAWVRRPDAPGWELVDETGAILLAPAYPGVRAFSDGLAWVSRGGDADWTAIEPDGTEVTHGGFEEVRPFRGGVAAVRRGGWGAVNRDGRMVVPPRYHGFRTVLADGRQVDGFTDEGLAVVEVGGLRGVVNRAGKVLVAPAHPALVIHPVAFLATDGTGRWGALDRDGGSLIDPVHPGRDAVLAEIDLLLADAHPVL